MISENSPQYSQDFEKFQETVRLLLYLGWGSSSNSLPNGINEFISSNSGGNEVIAFLMLEIPNYWPL